jgi:ABC-type transport system involved in multi-copper enzyme maturation permease subunit
MTGERGMNGSALLEYFQPLYEFLKAKNTIEGNSGEYASDDQTVPIVVGAVLLGVVVVVIIGYLIFRRRAAKRNATA